MRKIWIAAVVVLILLTTGALIINNPQVRFNEAYFTRYCYEVAQDRTVCAFAYVFSHKNYIIEATGSAANIRKQVTEMTELLLTIELIDE